MGRVRTMARVEKAELALTLAESHKASQDTQGVLRSLQTASMHFQAAHAEGLKPDNPEILFQRILQFARDSENSVRATSCGVLAHICLLISSSRPNLVGDSLSRQRELLEDSDPHVIAAAVEAQILYEKMGLSCGDVIIQQIVPLRDICFEMYSQSFEVVRLSVISYLTSLILLLSDDANDSGVRVSADSYLSMLTNLFRSPRSSADDLAAVIFSIASICRHRSIYVTDCVKSLLMIRFEKNRPLHIPTTQWPRILHLTKITLTSLAKLPVTRNWWNSLNDAARQIGLSVVALRKQAPILTKRKASLPSAHEGLSQNVEEHIAKKKKFSTIVSLDFKTLDSIHNSSLDKVLDVVFRVSNDFQVPEIQVLDERLQELQKDPLSSFDRRRNLFEGMPLLEKVSSCFQPFISNLFIRSIGDPRLRSKVRRFLYFSI